VRGEFAERGPVKIFLARDDLVLVEQVREIENLTVHVDREMPEKRGRVFYQTLVEVELDKGRARLFFFGPHDDDFPAGVVVPLAEPAGKHGFTAEMGQVSVPDLLSFEAA